MFSTLIDKLKFPAFRIERSGRILSANKPLFSSLASPPEKIIGKTLDELRFSNLFPSDLITHLKSHIEQVLRTGHNLDVKTGEFEISILTEHSTTDKLAALWILMQPMTEQIDSVPANDMPSDHLPDMIPVPAFILEANGMITGCNSHALKTMFAAPGRCVSGLNIISFIHPEDREGLRNMIASALEGDSVSSCEARAEQRDNHDFLWYSITARKVLTGSSPSVLAIATAITRRKQLEESLRISETKFSRLFDGHSTVMLVIDVNTKKIIDANRAAAGFYGWPLDQLCKMSLDQLTVGSDVNLEQEITEIREFGKKTVSFRQQRADGDIRDVEASTSLIVIQGQEVFYCIIKDVTERKRIETALRFSKSQLDFALARSHIGWWSINLRNGSAVRTLEHARIFGYDSTRSIWTYRRFLAHVIPEDRKRVNDQLLQARAMQSDWQIECRIRRPDRAERWILVIGGFRPAEPEDEQHISGIVMDISERKYAEIELRENQKRFDLALSAAHAGVWEWNLETGKIVWSNEINHLYGLEKDQPPPTFERWENSIHPDDRQATIASIRLAVRKKRKTTIEYRVCWPDGSVHWLMSRGQPVENDDKKLIGFIGTVIDTTERRELLEKVSQSEAELHSLFDNMLNGFARCQILYDGESIDDFVFLKVNRKFEELTGIENATGKRVTEIIPGIRTSDDEFFRLCRDVARSGKPKSFDYFVVALQEWFSISAYSPKPDCFIVIFDVITKRKQTEQSLRESENKFRTITEQMSEIVFVTDFSGKISYISPSIEKSAGYKPEELIDQLFFSFLAEEEVERSKQIIRNALATRKEAEVFEMKYRKKDGSLFYGEVSTRFFYEQNGNEFFGLMGVIRDITQKKKDEEEKKRLELQLQNAERLETVGRLAGGIAHEFNNLLSPILGYAELGMLNATEEGSNPEYYTAIIKASERARHLISQILTFSKSHESTPTVVRIQSIVEEALKLLRPSIPANVSIEQHIDEKCRNIFIDPSRLHQVIINLCTNAYQAIDKKSGLITIELREIVPGKVLMKKLPRLAPVPYAQLTITDNGTGIDKKTIQHIFEPFFSTKSGNKGYGLGLSVVHGIITGYKGEILVESRPGLSTSFFIYLPVIEQSTEQKKPDNTPQHGKGNILFVDDEKVILNMIGKMLTKTGFDTCTTDNPLEAIELFKQNPHRFDLVITDLTMPQLSGLELAAELKKSGSQVPIILLTGYGKDIENVQSLNKYGIRKILKKPARLSELVSTINEYIETDRH